MKKLNLQLIRKFKEIRKNRSLETFNRINTELAPLREAKKATIHTLAGIGNQYKMLRYPILAFLFIFIFLYNFFYYSLLKFRVHEKVARAISFVLVIALVLDGIYVPVVAYNRAENGEAIEEMCLNHPFHDEFCGYVEAVEGQPCNHAHTEECYVTTEFCLHLHDDSCYEMQNVCICGEEEREASFDVSGNEEDPGHAHTEECYELQEILICDHVCSEENGCIKVEFNCQHVHDEECGYVEAVEGSPCMHTCALCDGSMAETVSNDVTDDAVTDVSGNIVSADVFDDVSGNDFSDEGEQFGKEKEEAVFVPFTASQTIGNVEILVSAPCGVFPEGATLRATQIVNQKAEEIENLVNEVVDANGAKDEITTVEETYSFDIEILDAQGNICEPDLSKGQVNVAFKNVGAANAEIAEDKEVTVFYVDDEIANVEEIDSSVNVEEDSAVFEAEHFSIYTVVITSGTKKDTYLHYYQGSSRANSHFTIYNETQLVKYRDLYNAFVAGTVKSTDSIATILVNSDDANPMEGITELGQAADLVVGDLNFAAAIMDDIVVNSQWTPIASVPSKTVLEGYGHTVTLKSLVNGTYNWGDAAKESNAFVGEVLGTINNLTVIGPDGENTKIVYSSNPELEDDTEYATLTIRVDGEKVDIGKAITGAETLAVSCDGENYITLERYDDWAVYRTPLENLEEGVEYTVYYVYEDENETISQSTIRRPTEEELLENPSREGEYQIELDYVSVTYDLEYANTQDPNTGKKGMSAVRVLKNSAGSVEAQEDFVAVVSAVEGHAVPTRSKNVKVFINDSELILDTDFIYEYINSDKVGRIEVKKEKINAPILVKVQADSLEDSPVNTIYLNARSGSVVDGAWEETSTPSVYKLNVYEDTELPTYVAPINGSTAIEFEGWYTDYNFSTKVETYHYVEGSSGATYYAKWIMKDVAKEDSDMFYSYYANHGNGILNVQGRDINHNSIMVTYYEGGLEAYYNVGELNDYQKNGSSGGNQIFFPYQKGADAFVRVGGSGSNIYMAMVCTLTNGLVDLTYVFENRGNTDYSTPIYFGHASDVDIDYDDGAKIEEKDATNGTHYMTMTSRGGKEFRLYTSGSSFGIDAFYSYWYGWYGSHDSKVFTNSGRETGVSDSALAFSWKVSSIPSHGFVTKSTKVGIADASLMNQTKIALQSGNGAFADGTTEKHDISDKKQVIVNANGTVTVKKSSGDVTIAPPSRIGYKFDYWSVGTEGGNDCAGKTFSDDTTLVANYIPQPDRSVTNNASVQKVDGSDKLLVPSTLANIVLYNKTPGSDYQKIEQGATINEAAGYASGFTCELAMEGEDDRYLLPDDVEILIVDPTTKETILTLTKGTGYDYTLWNNRRKATLDIHNQYIKGDVIINTVGYELPPVTATSVIAQATPASISYGNKAVFTATAETSKNHLATYQWYIAPKYISPIDGSWTYQNQNGIPLENLNQTIDFGDNVTNPGEVKSDPQEVYITGAHNATLRIGGLKVNPFGNNVNDEGLHLGGYHLYCVVTSVRNITGQTVVATSPTIECEVTQSQYPAPTGLVGSATSLYDKTDGSILIENQERTKLLYKLKTDSNDSNWTEVTSEQLSKGIIENLAAGTYQFKYAGDANSQESSITEVTVDPGKYIIVTYRATGCNEEALRNQYKHVGYNSTVTASTNSLVVADGTIQNPTKQGYTFKGWEPAEIENITENTVVNAVFDNSVVPITLNNNGADAGKEGTAKIYEKYSTGFFFEETCTNSLSGTGKVTTPVKTGYDFLGYYTTDGDEGVKFINEDGKLSENANSTMYLEAATLYAKWKAQPASFDVVPENIDPYPTEGETPEEPEGVEVEIVPTGEEEPIEKTEDCDADSSYEVTVINNTGEDANVIYIYSNGELKKTLVPVEFDEENKYTFTLVPNEVGGGTITFVVGHIKGESEEEIKTAAEQEPTKLEYAIVYKDGSSAVSGAEFSGTFVSVAPDKGVKGVATKLPTATKTGYSFGGWYTVARCLSNKAISAVPADFAEETITVYAKWMANSYFVTLQTNGGTVDASVTIPREYLHDGEDVALPAESKITKENYRFTGWYDNEACSGTPVTAIDADLVGDVTYYAGWELLPTYTVTLTEDGVDGRIYKLTPCDGYTTTVYYGKEFDFTVWNASAYAIKSVKADGRVLTKGNDGVYKVTNIIDDTKITVDYNLLVSTDEADKENAVAQIELVDGTTGYFGNLDDAINYAAKYGTNSVIKLLKDIENAEIEIPAGNEFTIDANGHNIGIAATGTTLAIPASVLVNYGGTVTITDSAETKGITTLTVENNGYLKNDVVVDDLKNYGLCDNLSNGVVSKMLQKTSDNYPKSKFTNYGTVNSEPKTIVLESGYFVENVLDTAPTGLTGYNTIMNGNEYYVSFQDAVDIANVSEDDATILMLDTVDNRDTTITIGNSNDKKIIIDLNGQNISSGNLALTGDVEFVNNKAFALSNSTVSANIDNDDSLTVGDRVTLSKPVDNDGDLLIKQGGSVSGAVDNGADGNVTNKGSLTGILTNNGTAFNDIGATMNNVDQKDGKFTNKGTVSTEVKLEKGSYTVYRDATPQVPTGSVVCDNLEPKTYFASFAEAIEYVDSEECPGGTDSEPYTLTVLEDIPDLGGSPVVIDSDFPVIIDVDGHQLGDETKNPAQVIEIGGDTTITDSNDSMPKEGNVGADVKVDENGTLGIDDDVNVDGDVKNEGTLDNKGKIDGKVDNTGTFTNDGDISGDVTNDGNFTNNKDENGNKGSVSGTFENKENGTLKNKGDITGEVTNKGDIDNKKGATLDGVNQQGGKLDNEGTINDLEQTGGNTTNKGTITDVTGVTGGGFEGNGEEAVSKVAKITIGDETVYFADLDSALEYAAEQETPTTVVLLDDIVGQPVDLSGKESTVTLDLAGHKISSDSPITIEEEAGLVITDSSQDKKTVESNITNKGTLENEVTINGNIDNRGEFTNDNTVNGTTTNTGDIANNGTLDDVVLNDGTLENKGSIDEVTATKGTYIENSETPTAPEKVTGFVAEDNKEPRSYFASFDDIEDAVNKETETSPYKITITQDIPDLGEDDVTLNPKTDVEIDLNGHDLGSDTDTSKIKIGDDEGTNGKPVTFEDTKGTGTVNNDIEVNKDGKLNIEDNVTENGNIDNEGSFTNEGKVNGNVINEDGGNLDNKGTLAGYVTNKGEGDVVNEGTINGDVTNEGSGDIENRENAKIDGGVINSGAGTVENKGEVTKDVTNSGTGKVDNDGKVDGNVENTGHGEIDNSGTITGTVTNGSDGTFVNEKNGKTGDVTNEGTATNKGEVGTVTQKDGSFDNDGTTGAVTQEGGTIDNEGTINGDVSVSGGTYKGEDPVGEVKHDGAKVKVVDENGQDKYYSTLQDAIDDNNGNVTITLLDDIAGEDINIDKPGVVIDLNGHDILNDTQSTPPSTNSITVGPEGTGVVLKDSSTSEKGGIDVPITNKGELEIGEGVDVEKDVTNEGTLENKGDIKGTTTNSGNITNEGTIAKEVQNGGFTDDNGTIGELDLNKGGFQSDNGTAPSDAVAKIGTQPATYFADLESAIEHANEAEEDTKIDVLKDTSLPSSPATEIGNEDKKVTIDLNGHSIEGPLEVKKGEVVIDNSDNEGDGGFVGNIVVEPESKLDIEEKVTVDGNLTNNGTTENNGTVDGTVTNNNNASFTNDGTITENVINNGDMTNNFEILGNVTNNENAEFNNEGDDSFVGGNFTNKGDLDNEGLIYEKLDNIGNVDNSGTLHGDVNNHGSGTLENDANGSIDGKLNNLDEAELDNSGYVHQVNQEGGRIENEVGGKIDTLGQIGGTTDNQGTIDQVALDDIDNYSGQVPTKGIDGVVGVIEYIDDNGHSQIAYYEDLDELLADIENKAKNGSAKVVLYDDVNDKDIVITKPGVVIDLNGHTIDELSSITVDENGGLDITNSQNKGKVDASPIVNNGTLEIENGVTVDDVDNNGTFVNEGIIDKLTNNSGATSENKGKVNAVINNNGNLSNEGEIIAINNNAGDIVNSGKIGEIASNTGNINNSGEIDKVSSSGNITNTGDIDEVIQNGGTVTNTGTGTIDTEIFNDGIYKGTQPATKFEGVAAKVGDTYYEDINDAIEDINKAQEDVTLELYKDADFTEKDIVLDNENGKNITINLNGNDMTADSFEIGAPGKVTVSGGDINGGVIVDEGAALDCAEGTEITGDVENKGTLETKGNITGNVQNAGTMVSEGDITGNVENSGKLDSIGDISGDVTNTSEGEMTSVGNIGGNVDNDGILSNNGNITGDVDNAGTMNETGDIGGNVVNSGSFETSGDIAKNVTNAQNATIISSGTIEGNVNNAGSFDNEGVIKGKTDNYGRLDNEGSIIGNVTNNANAELINEENAVIEGKLTNEDNASVENSGELGEVEQTGGSILNKEGSKIESLTQTNGTCENNGTINVSEIEDLHNFTGKEPQDGLDAPIVIKTTDSEGKEITEYLYNIEEAVKKANEAAGDTVISLNKDLEITKDPLVIGNENGKEITLDLGGYTLGGEDDNVEISGSTKLTDSSTGEEKGELDANITVKEEASLIIDENTSVAGDVNNSGTMTNEGTITGNVDNFGTTDNSGTITGEFTNEPDAEFGNSGELEGNVINSGHIENEGNVTGDVTNEGTMESIGTIIGDVANEGTMESTGTIIGDVANEGTMESTGTITGDVTNAGEMTLDGTVDGNLENTGTATNSAVITGNLTNTNDGEFENSGEIDGYVVNEGKIANEGIIDGELLNASGSEFTNVGPEGMVEGIVTNYGDFKNEGAIDNNIINKGTLSSTGDILGCISNSEDATLINEGNIEGNIENEGLVENNGTIEGDIDNSGSLENSGNIDGNLENTGTTLNTGTFEGVISNEPEGKIENEGEINAPLENKGTVVNTATITGDLINAPEAEFENNGEITGNVENEGSLVNEGSITGDITNEGSAELVNNGDVDGKLTNSDEATVENNGNLAEVEQNGGSIVNNENATMDSLIQTEGTCENNGIIDTSEIEDLHNFTGNEPQEGFEAPIAVKITDSEGNVTTKYFYDIEEAIEEANAADGDVTVSVNKDLEFTADPLVIGNENGKQITIDLGGNTLSGESIEINGPTELSDSTGEDGALNANITVDEEASFDILENVSVDGNVENNGTLTNEGVISGDFTNNGEAVNEGTVSGDLTNNGEAVNEGTVSGDFTNNGEAVNEGTVSGDFTNNGEAVNEGTVSGDFTNNGEVENEGIIGGKVENTGSFENKGEIAGEVVNEGKLANEGIIEGTLTNTVDGEFANVGTDSAVNGDVTNYGVLENEGTLSGDVTNGEEATLVSEGTIGGNVENEGSFENNGNIEGNLENIGSFENNGNVEGNLENEGSLENNGTIEGNLENSGITVNNGTVEGELTNAPDAEFENKGEIAGKVVNEGKLSNEGTIEGELINEKGAEFSNIGTESKVNGVVTNYGYIENEGVMENGVINQPGSDYYRVVDGKIIYPPKPEEPEEIEEIEERVPVERNVIRRITPVDESEDTEETRTTRNVLEENNITSEEAAVLIESENEDDMQTVKELLEEAVEYGNVVIQNSIETVDEDGNVVSQDFAQTGILNTTIDNKACVELIETVLTPEEKIEVLEGTLVTIRAAMKDIPKELLDETADTILKNEMPENTKPVSFLNLEMFKKVGDGEETRIENAGANVTFEIPEEYRPTDKENVTYKVMRIYKDETGKECSEIVEIEQDGFVISLYADTDSQYILLEDEAVPEGILDKDLFEEETNEETLTEDEESGPCGWHWGIAGLTLAYLVALYALRKKDKKVKVGLLAGDLALCLVGALIGTCGYDWIPAVVNAAVAVPMTFLYKPTEKQDIE